MPTDGTIPILLLALYVAAMATVIVWDLVFLEIPNTVSVLLVAGFAVGCWWAGVSWSSLVPHLLTAAAVFVVCLGLFLPGWFGGGDVKLATAIALWFGWPAVVSWMLFVSLAGFVISVGMLIFNRRFAAPSGAPEWVARLHRVGDGVPYGIAIGIGSLALTGHALDFMKPVVG